MEPIAWELSNVKIEDAPQFVQPTEGRQIVKILSAIHDKNAATYTIKFWSANNGAQFEVRYNLKKVSKIDGSLVDNQMSLRNLNSLARAIYGPELAAKCSVPNPVQATGCAVVGDIKINPYDYTKPKFDENGQPVLDENGQQIMEKKHRDYVNIYEFAPICESDVKEYSDHPDQYCVADVA